MGVVVVDVELIAKLSLCVSAVSCFTKKTRRSLFVHVQCREKVFAPVLISVFFANLLHTKVSVHQTNFSLTQRQPKEKQNAVSSCQFNLLRHKKEMQTNQSLCERVIAP